MAWYERHNVPTIQVVKLYDGFAVCRVTGIITTDIYLRGFTTAEAAMECWERNHYTAAYGAIS